jgi:hypothetical protein
MNARLNPRLNPPLSSARKQMTIWEALKAKIGRDPTREELKAEWNRILRNE